MAKNPALVKDIIIKNGGHLSAVEIWECARSQGESVSLATVYNIVHRLVEQKELLEINTGDGASRYDARVDDHTHLVCARCKTIQDVDMEQELLSQLATVAASFQFNTHMTEVTLKGVCSQCVQSLEEK